MAISIETPRQELEISSSSWSVSLAIVFLALSVGLYVLFIFLTQSAQQEVERGTELLKTGVTPNQKELESKVLGYQQKIQDIVPLLERHNLPSVFLDSLEKTSHPFLQITKLSFDASKGSISLEGVTENFETLAQQAALLKKESYIKTFAFQGYSLAGKGKFLLTPPWTLTLILSKTKNNPAKS